MTYPPQTPGPVPPPAPVARRRAVSGGMIIAVLVGLVVGGGGVGLGWMLSGDGGTGAQADAHTACEIIGRVGPLTSGQPGDGNTNVLNIFRINAASLLANDAHHEDSKYASLDGTLQKANADGNMYRIDDVTINNLVNQAKAECAPS